MTYDPAERLLSISFPRDVNEHADVMFSLGRRVVSDKRTTSPWTGFAKAIGLGAVIGVVMELHRRFVLPSLFDPLDLAPLGVAIVQVLPLVLIALAVFVFIYWRTLKHQRQAVLSRLAPGLVFDVEIFKRGVMVTTGAFTVEIDWPFVSDVYVDGERVEIECESLSIYIPLRAFQNRAAFDAAFRQIRSTWREAAKRQRDAKLVAAKRD